MGRQYISPFKGIIISMDEIKQPRRPSSNKKIKNIFSGELHTLESYVQRLFYIVAKIKKDLKANSELKELLIQMNKNLPHLFIEFIGKQDEPAYQSEFCFEEIEQKLLHGLHLSRSLLWLKNDTVKMSNPFKIIINSYYDFCFNFHQIIDPYNHLKIQLPRTSLISVVSNQKVETIPKFHLTTEKIEAILSSPGDYVHLEDMRDKQYHQHLQLGHQHIYEKSYAKALESFTKASKIKITSQCLNLIGWVHSLQGNMAQAKEHCLEAIKIDPNLGDPYNDMGSYLLLEGKIKECLEWFNLAKKAKHYVNREFPYINAGKAYLMEKKYDQALHEFSTALEYVPYQQELVKTIKKLRNMISKKKQRTNLPNDLPEDLEL